MSFQEIVDNYIFRNIYEIYQEPIFGTTSKNQQFALIINKIAWFAIRLLIKLDDRFDSVIYVEKLSEHLTLNSLNNKCDQIIEGLRDTRIQLPISEYNSYDSNSKKIFFFARRLHSRIDEITPDFLLPGDHIRINRNNLYFHHAIYIGENRVIQVSMTNGQIEECGFSEFIGNEPIELDLISYVFRSKRKDEIILAAKNYVGSNKFDEISLNMRSLYFAITCATSLESSQDQNYQEFDKGRITIKNLNNLILLTPLTKLDEIQNRGLNIGPIKWKAN